KSHLVPYLWMNDISGAAEVRDYRYTSSAEGFENYACTIIAKRWKHEQISRSEALENFGMAEPAAERNSLLDPKGSCKLLETVSLRAIADHGKAGQVASQKRSRSAQTKITSFPGNQPANEEQLKFGPRLRTTRIAVTQRTSDARLRDKEQFVAVLGKLGIRLGRSGYDGCRVTIGGASERQVSIEISQVGDPLLLVLELAKAGRPRQTTIERADHERYGSLA